MAAPKHIQKRINDLIALVKANNKKVSLAICTKEVSILKELYTINTVHTYLTFYVKEFKTKKIDAEITNRLRIGRHSEMKRNKQTRKNRLKKLSSLKPINNLDGIISYAKGLLKSDKYPDLVAGLCLLTGRRSTEILKTAKFERIGNSKNTLMFKGQLKKKGKQYEYRIFALGDSASICKRALSKIRKAVKATKLTEQEVHNKYQNVVRAACMKHYYPFIGLCSPHNLRACYSVICCQLFKPESVIDNIFIASILGHDSDDIDTANSYRGYYIRKKY